MLHLLVFEILHILQAVIKTSCNNAIIAAAANLNSNLKPIYTKHTNHAIIKAIIAFDFNSLPTDAPIVSCETNSLDLN